MSAVKKTALVLALGLSAVAQAFDFVGSESCRTCHPEAFEAWRQSKHARAKESLTPLQQKDARCVTCHSPNEAEQSVAHVTCETCHGGGQYYATSFVMKDTELVRLVGLTDPSEKGCRTCHDASSPSLKPFEFVEKLKAIDHWTAERQRRVEAAEKPVKK
jgi:Cytochrome c7 and related cytochrome c